jgi:hypothetical protein
MLHLPAVTLCCIDARNHALALRALARSRREIRFARTLFLTDAVPPGVDLPEGIEMIPSGPIRSFEDYSRIVLKGLYPQVATSHVLVVQWDGYVAHPELWMDEFLDWDYLGAPWPDGKGGYSVGNGGFSLRSRKLLEALQDDRFPLLTNTEDVTICGHHRPRLESDFGIRFGPADLAKWFSFEMDARDVVAGQKTFGFHGLFNLFAVESEEEIAAVAPLLSDAILVSEIAELLLKNLVKFHQYEAACALGQRMLEVRPENRVAADALVLAGNALESQRAPTPKENRSGLASRILRKVRTRH